MLVVLREVRYSLGDIGGSVEIRLDQEGQSAPKMIIRIYGDCHDDNKGTLALALDSWDTVKALGDAALAAWRTLDK